MKLVLDTNVVLDWLLFEHPSIHPLRDRIEDRRVTLITHLPAIEELRRVLAYKQFDLDATRQRDVLERYEARASRWPSEDQTPVAGLALPQGFPHCRDPDDDPFIALTYHARADALVSKDKRVLKLRRRCSPFGFRILSIPQLTAALE